MLCVREGTEGLYAGNGGVLRRDTPQEIATEVSLNTAFGVERVVRYAFERAVTRPRKHLTLIHKTNVLTHAGGLWSRTVGGGLGRVPRGHRRLPARRRRLDVLHHRSRPLRRDRHRQPVRRHRHRHRRRGHRRHRAGRQRQPRRLGHQPEHVRAGPRLARTSPARGSPTRPPPCSPSGCCSTTSGEDLPVLLVQVIDVADDLEVQVDVAIGEPPQLLGQLDHPGPVGPGRSARGRPRWPPATPPPDALGLHPVEEAAICRVSARPTLGTAMAVTTGSTASRSS